MTLIDLVAGARPNFMKIAPIIRAIESDSTRLKFRLIHTGQHYDRAMSEKFFIQLGLPQPDYNLEVGSGSQAQQAGKIMCAYESLLFERNCDLCIVVGDVTSTLAAAITAQKLQIPVAHVEGGIRSGDWTMPEEINRRVTDSISNWFFTTSKHANQNLKTEGVDGTRIYFVGNTMIDTLLSNLENLRPPEFWEVLGLEIGNYLVLTLHRPGNVDEPQKLANTLKTIANLSGGLPVVFPVHPRTARFLNETDELPANLFLVDPQPYLEFNYLVENSLAVITDSGGITEEATVLGVPCMTLRDNTERPETIEIGTNELVGTKAEDLAPYMEKLFAGKWKKGGIPELWDGNAGKRIVSHLEELLD
ncbi:MAG: UDP-N-acetylglucosamine 2-epimerase (non-hydrolyzing) [Gammaproteobacteria bacterium]